MKHKKTILGILFLLLGLRELQAQEGLSAASGESVGAGGKVSYTIGQLIYTTAEAPDGILAQGVQQPYIITSTVGLNETTISLDLIVYPNPATNYLILKTADNANLSYQLFDMQGKIIETKIVSGNSTNISLAQQPPATYLLSVLKNNQMVKTFKVVKN